MKAGIYYNSCGFNIIVCDFLSTIHFNCKVMLLVFHEYVHVCVDLKQIFELMSAPSTIHCTCIHVCVCVHQIEK